MHAQAKFSDIWQIWNYFLRLHSTVLPQIWLEIQQYECSSFPQKVGYCESESQILGYKTVKVVSAISTFSACYASGNISDWLPIADCRRSIADCRNVKVNLILASLMLRKHYNCCSGSTPIAVPEGLRSLFRKVFDRCSGRSTLAGNRRSGILIIRKNRNAGLLASSSIGRMKCLSLWLAGARASTRAYYSEVGWGGID